MQKWEYLHLTVAYANEATAKNMKVKAINDEIVPNWKNGVHISETLNQLGSEGWELIHVVWRGYYDPFYVLKRPKNETDF